MALKRSAGKSAILVGFIVGLVIQMLAAALIAYLIYSERIEPGAGKYLAYAALVVGTAIAGIVPSIKCGSKIAVTAALAIGLDALVLAAIGILLFDGFGSGTLTGLLCILIGYLLSCAICIMRGKKRGKRKRLAV